MEKRMKEYVEDAVDQAVDAGWYDLGWRKYERDYQTCEFIEEVAKSMICSEMDCAANEEELKELEEYECSVDNEAYKYYYRLLKEKGIIKDYEFDQNGCTVYLPIEMGKVEVYRKISNGDSDTKEYVCFKDGEERDASFVDNWGNYLYEYVGDYKPGDCFYTYYLDDLSFESDEYDSKEEAEQAMKEYCRDYDVGDPDWTAEKLYESGCVIKYEVTDQYWNDDYYVETNEVVCAEIAED